MIIEAVVELQVIYSPVRKGLSIFLLVVQRSGKFLAGLIPRAGVDPEEET